MTNAPAPAELLRDPRRHDVARDGARRLLRELVRRGLRDEAVLVAALLVLELDRQASTSS